MTQRISIGIKKKRLYLILHVVVHYMEGEVVLLGKNNTL